MKADVNSEKNPAQRKVLISGAAGGIGTELVRRFVDDGDFVIATDIDESKLQQLAQSIDRPSSLMTHRCDVASQAACQALASAVTQRCAQLDVLVNNAGYFPVRPFEAMSYEEWRMVVTTNLDSVFLMTQAFLPLLKNCGRGRIVNMGSGSFFKGTIGQSHYVAAKAGVIGLSRSLAWELGSYGINVNVVTPGLTATASALELLPAEAMAARRNQRPIKRDQVAGDLVGAVAFLASRDADFMTGQIVNVDGGTFMH